METARGMELRHISTQTVRLMSELVAPLKSVREHKATKEDIQRYKDNLDKRDGAMKVCEEKIYTAQAGYEAEVR